MLAQELALAWNDKVEAEDKDVANEDLATYVDALGKEHTEHMQPLPPASLRSQEHDVYDHGPSFTLARHLGEQRWAHKGDDLPSLQTFDDTLSRPTERFASTSVARLQDRVGRDRTHTQPAPERDEMDRSAMYQGYNVSLPREQLAKPLPPTRRHAQPAEVVGAERRGDAKAPVHANMVATMRTGAFDAHDRAGAPHRGDARATIAATAPARATGLFDATDHASHGRVAGATARTMLAPRGVPLADDAHARPVDGDGRFGTVASATVHAAVQVGRWNDVGVGNVATRVAETTTTASALRAGPVLGTRDAAVARAPIAKTFAQAAAHAGAAVLGTRDSAENARADVPTTFTQVAARAGAAVLGTRDSAANARKGPVAHPHEAPQLHASRGRDHGRDATQPTRTGLHEHATMHPALSGAVPRALRVDGMQARDPTLSHGTEAFPAWTAAVRMNGTDAAPLADVIRSVAQQDGWVASVRAAHARAGRENDLATNGTAVGYGPDVGPVAAFTSRRWRDADTLSRSAPPLPTGVPKHLVAGEATGLTSGRETPTRVPGAMAFGGQRVRADYVRRGVRD